MELFARKFFEMFVYKHTETIEYVKKQPTFFKKIQTLRVNNLRVTRTKNTKFSEYYLLFKHEHIRRF